MAIYKIMANESVPFEKVLCETVVACHQTTAPTTERIEVWKEA
jgi:hypothetical protein